MLFDQYRTQRRGGDRYAGAHGVIGQADFAAERIAHVGNGADIRVFRCRGIGAGAFQDADLFVPGFARGAQRFTDFDHAGHAGGNDHRLAGSGHLADQCKIDRFEAGDLVGRDVQFFEEIDCGRIEGGRKTIDAKAPGMIHQRLVPVPRRMRLFVQVVESAARPQAVLVLDHEARHVDVERQRIGSVCLQLDGIRTVLRCSRDDFHRAVQRMVMIAAHFRDQIRPLVARDFASIDLHHGCFSSRIL